MHIDVIGGDTCGVDSLRVLAILICSSSHVIIIRPIITIVISRRENGKGGRREVEERIVDYRARWRWRRRRRRCQRPDGQWTD